jgi:hypothetical protein
MASALEPHLRLAVGHILLVDIVGYSKLLADEQKELIQELNRIVRETKRVVHVQLAVASDSPGPWLGQGWR